MYKFSEQQNRIEEAAKEVVKDILRYDANERNNNGIFPKEMIGYLNRLGYNSLMIPQEYEGSGLDAVSSLIVLKEIAKVDAAIAHVIETINFGFLYPIYQLGTEEQKSKYLIECAKGEKVGTLAYNEPEKEIMTFAEEVGDYFVINGKKTLITNAMYSDYALVYAKTNEKSDGINGYSMFIVDLKNSEGITFGKPEELLGLQSMKVSDIYFKDVKVHKSNLLNGKDNGTYVVFKAMEIMRVANAAITLGIAESAFKEALEYAKIRKIDDNPMSEMQLIRYKFADMKAELENMHLLTFYTAYLYDKNQDDVMLYSTISKLKVSVRAKEICDEALQVFGGYGCIRGYTIERLYRDIRVMTIVGGVSELMRSSISNSIFN